MNKKNIMSSVKKLTAGVLAVGIVITGIVVNPKQADAAVVEDKVIYVHDNENYNINDYWNADSTQRTVPVKEGYVFGGWFEAADSNVKGAEKAEGTENYYAPLTEEELKKSVPESAYAKFVPSQVLSVKAQNGVAEGGTPITSADKISSTNPMWVRVMTSIDSTNYDRIGFDIYLANKTRPKNSADGTYILETSKVFSGLYVGDAEEPTSANEIFGGVSEYVCVWKLNKIDTPSNADKIIYVRPYWYTMDGTKVNGLAKYVHIEDQYMGYVSVPINLLGGEAVAAGAVKLTYDNGDSSALQLIGFEAGRIFPEMSYSYTNKTINMVGNTDQTVGEFNDGETIYANLRFAEPDVDTDFEITYGQFCDWVEAIVDVKKAWDTKYVK